MLVLPSETSFSSSKCSSHLQLSSSLSWLPTHKSWRVPSPVSIFLLFLFLAVQSGGAYTRTTVWAFYECFWCYAISRSHNHKSWWDKLYFNLRLLWDHCGIVLIEPGVSHTQSDGPSVGATGGLLRNGHARLLTVPGLPQCDLSMWAGWVFLTARWLAYKI